MKYLELFEAKKPTYWIVNYYLKDNRQFNSLLFNNKESAELYLIELINNIRVEYEETHKNRFSKPYNDDIYFTKIDEALDWFQAKIFDIDIEYKDISVSDDFEPSLEFQRIKKEREFKGNVNKFNV